MEAYPAHLAAGRGTMRAASRTVNQLNAQPFERGTIQNAERGTRNLLNAERGMRNAERGTRNNSNAECRTWSAERGMARAYFFPMQYNLRLVRMKSWPPATAMTERVT